MRGERRRRRRRRRGGRALGRALADEFLARGAARLIADRRRARWRVHPLAHARRRAGPLAGVGILVTRPARQAAGLAQKLAVLGATPIVFPAIVILPPADRAPLDRAHAALDRYDIAIFVSANAVEYGVPAPGAWPATLRAFAPGPGTAEALAAVGHPRRAIPATTFDSEGLLALPELRSRAGKRVVIFRGDGGRDHLGDTLRARGARVDYVDCYRRAAPQSGADGLAEALRARARARGDDHVERRARQPVGAARRRRARALQRAARVRPASADRRARARARASPPSQPSGGDAGLIAGLLEWFASHPVPGA